MYTSSVKIVKDGVIKIDGGALFGAIPRHKWEMIASPDRKHRLPLGLNCMVLEVCGKKVLVDTGLGNISEPDDQDEFGRGYSRLLKELRLLGIRPSEINAIVLTHLHFDHSGGCTRLNRAGEIIATFPKATIYAQRAAWDDAHTPSERCCFEHRIHNLTPIADHIQLLDGDTEIYPGLNVIATGGHSPGHQIVMFQHGGERIVFLGDLVPTPYHLNTSVISAFDHNPEHTFCAKTALLQDAEVRSWVIAFGHGLQTTAGYLERRDGMTYLRPVEL